MILFSWTHKCLLHGWYQSHQMGKKQRKDYGQDPVVIALTANTLSEDRKKCQVGMVTSSRSPGFKQLEMALSKWSKN